MNCNYYGSTFSPSRELNFKDGAPVSHAGKVKSPVKRNVTDYHGVSQPRGDSSASISGSMHDLGNGDHSHSSASYNNLQFRSSEISQGNTLDARNHYPYYENSTYDLGGHDDLLSQIQGNHRKSEVKKLKSSEFLKSKTSQNSGYARG